MNSTYSLGNGKLLSPADVSRLLRIEEAAKEYINTMEVFHIMDCACQPYQEISEEQWLIYSDRCCRDYERLQRALEGEK